MHIFRHGPPSQHWCGAPWLNQSREGRPESISFHYRSRESGGGIVQVVSNSSSDGSYQPQAGAQSPPSRFAATARCTATDRMPHHRRVYISRNNFVSESFKLWALLLTSWRTRCTHSSENLPPTSDAKTKNLCLALGTTSSGYASALSRRAPRNVAPFVVAA